MIAAIVCVSTFGDRTGVLAWSARGTDAVVAAMVHSVSWYREHQSDLKQKLAACSDNPGAAMTDADCQNAAEAKSQIDLEEFQGKQTDHK